VIFRISSISGNLPLLTISLSEAFTLKRQQIKKPFVCSHPFTSHLLNELQIKSTKK
jgi:hypothetical protein